MERLDRTRVHRIQGREGIDLCLRNSNWLGNHHPADHLGAGRRGQGASVSEVVPASGQEGVRIEAGQRRRSRRKGRPSWVGWTRALRHGAITRTTCRERLGRPNGFPLSKDACRIKQTGRKAKVVMVDREGVPREGARWKAASRKIVRATVRNTLGRIARS